MVREQTRFVRRVDELGRVVLPKELRDRFAIAAGDQVEIWLDGGQVVLQRHVETCVFCGGSEALIVFKGEQVCGACRLGRVAPSGSLTEPEPG